MNKNHSYFVDNKNTNNKIGDNQILRNFENSCFLTYKSFNKYSKNRFSNKDYIDKKLNAWNWGAFYFTWFWGIFNTRWYIGILMIYLSK